MAFPVHSGLNVARGDVVIASGYQTIANKFLGLLGSSDGNNRGNYINVANYRTASAVSALKIATGILFNRTGASAAAINATFRIRGMCYSTNTYLDITVSAYVLDNGGSPNTYGNLHYHNNGSQAVSAVKFDETGGKLDIYIEFPAAITTLHLWTDVEVNWSSQTNSTILDSANWSFSVNPSVPGSPLGTATFNGGAGLDADLVAIAAISGTGILVRTGTDTWTTRSIEVTTGAASFAGLAVGNGTGVSGNPTISVETNNSTMKLSVEAATTANISLSGTQTIDGIALSAGQRCLVKNQSSALENGLWIVASGSWTRAVDYDTDQKAEHGLIVFVQGGTTNANTFWKVDQSKPTIGSTGLSFSQMSFSAGSATFLGLTDTPSSYSGEGGKFVRVNAGATALEFVSSPLVSLGGLTASTQTFAVGTTGTDFGIVSTGSSHTFNIPSASDTNRGLVTTGSQIFAGAKTIFGNLQVGAVGRSDSLVIANTAGNIAVITAGGNCTLVLPSGDGSSGNVLTTDGAGNTSWAAVSGLSSLNGLSGGTQTFATGTSGSDFGINSTGTAHTFNIPDASSSARGLVTTGAQTFGGEKTFRNNAILGAAGVATGQISLVGTTSGTFILKASAAAGTWTMTLPNTSGSSGQGLVTDGSGNMSWSVMGNVLQNGNSFGTSMAIGTNDNKTLSLKTNGGTAATFGTDGVCYLYSLGLSGTNAVVDRMIVDTQSSGTPAAGFGAALLFRLKSSTTLSQDAAKVSCEWVVATHASRTGNVVIYAQNNAAGVAEMARIGPASAGGVAAIRIGAGGTTQYLNAGITTGTSYTLGNSSNALQIGGSTGIVTISTSATGSNAIVIAADAVSNNSARIQIGNGAATHTTGTKHTMAIVQGYTVASGSGELVSLYIDPTINQTSTASGSVYGVRIAPTFTGLLGQYYGLYMTFDNASAWGVYQSGSATKNLFAGNVGLGTATTPNRPLQVGSTSAITIPVGTTAQRPASPQVGDIRVNSSVNIFEYYDGSDWQTPGGGSATFLSLTDTPSTYSGQGLKYVRVNSGATALEFTDPPTDHGALTGLSDDDHTIYALLAGRSGGQTLTGGTASSNALVLRSTSNATKGLISLADQGGHVTIGGGTAASELRFYEASGSGSNYTGFVAGAMSADIMYTLPTTAPSDGQYLRWNTGGVLSWQTPAGGGSGDVNQGGNSFGAAMIIGTNDNNTLSFEQNGTTAATFGTDKNLTLVSAVAATNTVTQRLVIQTNSTGTAAAGFGTGLQFQAESSTTDNQVLGTIEMLWSTATHASRTSDVVITGINSASAIELIRFKAASTPYFTIGNGATQWSNVQIAIASGVNFTFSANAGVILPSGTTAQRVDATGAIRYNSSTGRTECYTDSIWRPIDQGSIVDINAQTGTTYTLAFNDIGQLVTLDNASAITLTIPTNASVAFPIGTTINLYRKGAGTVTVGGASVTIRSADSKLKLRVQYSTASLTKIGTDEWVLFGDISA